MSLINDALKRARQTRQPNPFGGDPSEPMRPIEDSRRPELLRRIILALCICAALSFSAWFFQKWLARRSTAGSLGKSRSRTSSRPVIHVSTEIVVRTNFVEVPRPEPAKPAALMAASAPMRLTNAPASASTSEPLHPRPPFADLKLQSIVFREDKPAVVINGEMLFVGDRIAEARVVRIDRQAVVVERNGETNELRLPRL